MPVIAELPRPAKLTNLATGNYSIFTKKSQDGYLAQKTGRVLGTKKSAKRRDNFVHLNGSTAT